MKSKYQLRFQKNISEDTLITGYLNVAGNVNLNSTLTVTTPAQGGGNVRIVPINHGGESSIGYYTRSDARATEIGDVWVCGINAWQNIGFSMGTDSRYWILFKYK